MQSGRGAGHKYPIFFVITLFVVLVWFVMLLMWSHCIFSLVRLLFTQCCMHMLFVTWRAALA